MRQQLLLLELNALNFDHLRHYAARGTLPTLSRLIARHGVAETTSEARYEELEPWIQWVTAHTGLPLAEHGAFRLGDIRGRGLTQIWEVLEAQGLRVGAVSPMNAENRCQDAAFFLPDPWTRGRLSARPLLARLFDAVSQAVNDNAVGRLTPASTAWLALAALRYARPANYHRYLGLDVASKRKPWTRAMFLDLLLADVFIRETRRTRPHFASLLLNAGAHIQHHYLFNSPAYEGGLQNPEWYAPAGVDPVGEAYRLYDRIVAQIERAFPEARLMIATGLHQDPHDAVTFYWRLKDHAGFLGKLGVPYLRVEPRMSRDFLIVCRSAEEAAEAERILGSAVGENGTPLFEVDNRGSDLFVMLTWPHDIPEDFTYRIGNTPYTGLREEVAFVAIKNGQHNGSGYVLDTGATPGDLPTRFPLAELPERVCTALGAAWRPDERAAAE